MRDSEASLVAQYHKDGIPTGLLAELGVGFMTPLYKSINNSEVGFVFVVVDANERVFGFVCGTTNLNSVFRRVLLKNAFSLGWRLLRIMFSRRTIVRLYNALCYPAKMQASYPKAELLSIVVDPAAQGSGAAGDLMKALFEEFTRRDVQRIKVMVGAHLERANAYYRKHGFEFAGTISSHGLPSNIYVIDLGKSPAASDPSNA